MNEAGKQLKEIEYKGTGDFAKKGSSKYNHSNAQDAYAQVLTYLNARYQ